MGWKHFVTGFLTFSRKDRIGVLALILLLVFAFSLPSLVPDQKDVPEPLSPELSQEINALKKEPESDDNRFHAFEPSTSATVLPKAALFLFDPNTLNDEGWRKLGLREKTIRTINNYRSKGGRFYKPEDLAKIWGLPPGFYERVKNHIRIEKAERRQTEQAFTYQTASVAKPPPALLDINEADTAAFIALPGIGAKLAARIVNFRDKLGGFTSVAQLGETYGLPDSTFQKIKNRLTINVGPLHTININTATKEALSAHPYINWKTANAIVAYRDQHGPFASVDELKKIMVIDESTFDKMKPYLSTQ